MVENPYYEVIGDTGLFPQLKENISVLGQLMADRFEQKYSHDPDNGEHKKVEIDTWANGPLLRLEEFGPDGEQRPVTTDRRLRKAILRAGYVPTSFRPEKRKGTDAKREPTGRWMWYLEPIGPIQDGDSDLFDSAFALQNEDGSFVRDDDDNLVTFDNENTAEAVRHDDLEVVEVNN